MKANELMIGDWVEYSSKYKHGIGKIAGIEPREGSAEPTTFTVIDDNLMLIGVSKVNVKPVPLTPEILEKNGFIKSVSPPGIHAKKSYELDNPEERYVLTIADYNKYKRLLLNIDSKDAECFNIKCDYVHQLQHALRLCGIEKEIVL